MARKMVQVHVDRSYTYDLNASQTRTLPVGWRGEVPANIGKDIKKRKCGRIIADPEPPKSVTQPKSATKAPDPDTNDPGKSKATKTGSGDGGQGVQ